MMPLSGLRVLLVEDEGAVALLIEDMLTDLGCILAASVARLEPARKIAATADIDLAVLDVNLGNQPVFPVARILLERRIPLIFSTGYGKTGLPAEFTRHPVLSKPFSKADLHQTIELALNR